MKDTKNKLYVSVIELANMLKISRVAVFKRIKNGQIPAQKIGRNYAIRVEDLPEIVDGADENILTDDKKAEIKHVVERLVKEYGETLRLLGKE
jgi:excisionase family DNA binding protein